MNFIPVVIASDNDGEEYLIPKDELKHFDFLIEKIEDVKSYSSEWYDLCDEFSSAYGKYKLEGSHPQFYVTQEDLEKFLSE